MNLFERYYKIIISYGKFPRIHGKIRVKNTHDSKIATVSISG